MGDHRRRISAAFASLAIATTALGFVAPPATAAPFTTTTTGDSTQSPSSTPTGSPTPTAPTSNAATPALIETTRPAPATEPNAARIAESTAAVATSEAPLTTPAPKLQSEVTAAGGYTGQTLLAELPTITDTTISYNRDYFNHWVDADGDGCDTRAEVLIAESSVPVTFGSGCTVATGQWTSPYDGAGWTAASDVDIDHVVPLAEAWRSSAWTWNAERRAAFANDLGYEHSLDAVTDNVNQSKSDQDPATWMPIIGQCEYAVHWVTVKWRWNLGVDAAERSALGSYLNGTSCGTAPVNVPEKNSGDMNAQKWPLYKIVYDSSIYELRPDSGGNPITVQLSFERWRDVYNFQAPAPASTDFVKYPWSPTLYAVTFWPGGESYWMWTRLSFEQWKAAGYPTARNSGWIKGSYYYKWGTSSEIFVLGEDGINHKLTGQEWADSGYRPYDNRSNEGLLKLTWAPEIAWMTNLAAGAGRPMGYAEWQKEAFPSARAVQRITGDMFYKDCSSSTIWYAGPGMNRPVSAQEWQAAGSPSPTVSGNCTSPAPAPVPTPSQPSRPADVDCGNFNSQAEAQAWYNHYYPYYGDVANLDGTDKDGRVCESLP